MSLDDPVPWCDCLSVQLSRGCACAKLAERIEVPFGVEIPGDLRHIVLDAFTACGFDADFAKLLRHLVAAVYYTQ